MGQYILRRFGYMIVTLVIVTILGYIIIELPPGSYVESEIQRLRALGGNLAPDAIEALYRRYGLDKPAYERFFIWITSFVRGDLGEAFRYNMPVSKLIFDRLGLTLVFSGLSLILTWVVAIFVGVYSATHRYTVPDYLITVLQFIGLVRAKLPARPGVDGLCPGRISHGSGRVVFLEHDQRAVELCQSS